CRCCYSAVAMKMTHLHGLDLKKCTANTQNTQQSVCLSPGPEGCNLFRVRVRSSYVEFACSPRGFVGFLRVSSHIPKTCMAG
uniref:Uncharacterized protein n=1 Tax=Hippocampus comes TaxID=109280 RepID=A0A3Q2XB55_HIPCM